MEPKQSLLTRCRWWLKNLAAAQRLRKLEREARYSEEFQRECERLRCFNLAALEEQYREQLVAEIKRQRMLGEAARQPFLK